MTQKYLHPIVLVFIHMIALLVLCVNQMTNFSGMFTWVFAFLILFGISSIYHLLLWTLTRNSMISEYARIPLYFVPLIVTVGLGLFMSVPRYQEAANQHNRLESPSGKYVMEMHIRENKWVVSVYDTSSGKELYRDRDSEFSGNVKVYWIWDDMDRLWLLNNGDEKVYYWLGGEDLWTKNYWGSGHTAQTNVDIQPPDDLFPKNLEEKQM